jgi:hypothetical protein
MAAPWRGCVFRFWRMGLKENIDVIVTPAAMKGNGYEKDL